MSYTPAQVSAMLDVPPSTLRRYAALFAAHLSATANRPKRSYSDADIAVLARVRDLARQGVTLDSIGPQLAVVGQSPETDTQPVNSLSLVPTIAAELEQLNAAARAANAQLAELRQVVAEQGDRLQRLESWVQAPWWKRVGRKPPV